MENIKPQNYGGTISRHISRLKAFGGGYTLGLAAALALAKGCDWRKAHRLAMELVENSEDPCVPTGEETKTGIEYTSRSGKKYSFYFPDYGMEGVEFSYPDDSALTEEFVKIGN